MAPISENSRLVGDDFGSPNLYSSKHTKPRETRRRCVVITVVVVVVLIIAAAVAVPLGIIYGNGANDDKEPVVSVDEILVHLRQFESIAKGHKNSRSIINGYNASFEYVKSQLDPDLWTLQTQKFVVPAYDLVEEPVVTFANPPAGLKQPHRCFGRTGWQRYEQVCDYSSIRYGGNTNGQKTFTGVPIFVPNACEVSEYVKAGVQPNSIVHVILPPTKNCTAFELVTVAERAGAVAVILENAGSTGIPGSRIFDSDSWFPELPKLPDAVTIGVSPQFGAILRLNPQSISIQANSKIVVTTSMNLIADAKFAPTNGDTLMVGAHLDSVPEGPGINDNGSGSASILSIALKLGQKKSKLNFKNGLRFAWWGAEEIGLMGSRFYVESLEKTPHLKPAAYFNLDMEASPNAIRGVHNGASVDSLPVKVSDAVKKAAFEIEKTWLDAFGKMGLTTVPSPMTGGSDFLPFLLGDIAAGGLATGAGAIKTAEERSIHGGLANAPLDPCYHASCDTVDNVGKTYLGQMSSAMMSVILSYVTRLDMSGYHAVEANELTATNVRAKLKKIDTNGRYCSENIH